MTACECVISAHRLCVLDVVSDDFGHLGKMPPVPLTHAHGICVQLLVQIIQQSNGLHNHGVHLQQFNDKE